MLGRSVGEVPDEDGDRVPELLGVPARTRRVVALRDLHVHRGDPAAAVRAVHHVVLHEGEHVEDLEGRAQADEVWLGGLGCARVGPSEPRHGGAQPLPAGVDLGAEERDQVMTPERGTLGRVVLELPGELREALREGGLDGTEELGVRGPEEGTGLGGGGHGLPFASAVHGARRGSDVLCTT